MSATNNFYKNKFEYLKITPPPSAWDRINNNLEKKQTTRKWWLMAASIIVLISAGLFFIRNSDQQPTVAGNEPNVISKPDSNDIFKNNQNNTTYSSTHIGNDLNTSNQTMNVHTTDHRISKTSESPTVSILTSPSVAKEKQKYFHSSNNQAISNEIAVTTITFDTIATETNSSSDKYTVAENSTNTFFQANDSASDSPVRVNLKYSYDELQSKFLKKKAIAGSSTPDSKNNFLINLSTQLRNPATVYQDLRNLKDELLTFSPKENKPHHAND